jgi:hypothetical protein
MCPKCRRSSLLVLVMMFVPKPTANAQDHRPTVVVYVYDNAKVPESVLAETGRSVREMFDKAGIELDWQNSVARLRAGETKSLDGASGKGRAIHVSVVIVPRPDLIAPKIRNLDGRMGWTPAGQHTRTYVFYERVQAFVLNNFARIYTLRVPRLLTYVIAHELGHLLLPLADTHAEMGIMKEQLNGNDLAELFSGALGFSSKEGQLMRDEIERRARLEEATR